MWRTIFFVNVPIGVAALIGAWFFLGESRAPGATRLDLPGAILVTFGLLLFIYPIVEGRDQGWPWWVWVVLAAAVPVLTVFVWYERRRTRADNDPLLRMSLFQDKAFVAGLALSVVFFAGLPPFFFSLAVYLQIGLGFSALGSGLTGFPFALGSALGASFSDKVAQRIGRRVLLLGTGLLVLGMVAILVTAHIVGVRPHTWQFSPAMFLSGLGLGFFIAPVINIILAGIRSEAVGAASGVLSTVQQVGGAIGVAAIGVILFGFIGLNAGGSADDVTPELREALAQQHLPLAVQRQVLDGFHRCFDDRSHAKDPTVLPASCRAEGNLPPQVTAALAKAGREALAKNFSRSYQQTLGYEILVFSAAFLLVFRLPDVDPHAMGPGATAAS